MKHEAGYVYILTNPSFKEDWVKIGKSSRPVDIRSKELDNTAVPLPFEIYATMKTVKAVIEEVYLKDKKCHIEEVEVASASRKRRPNFKFSMANIPIGSMITFIHTGLEVRVADDDHVEYDGRLYKLSPFVGTFLPDEKRAPSNSY